MSAANWAVCPKCLDKHNTSLMSQRTELALAYGKVNRNQYEIMSKDLAKAQRSGPDITLREDYEIINNNEGIVTIQYGANCTICKFSFTFKTTLDLLKMKDRS